MKTFIPAKPEQASWTNDQWKAIFAKDQDILVAAAAGSGKTAVLVERIIQRILAEKDPLNVDQLLVVTFTNASAAEMRSRIGEALSRAINDRPESNHLRKQLGLLNKASISTLHSFCLEVIRKFYYMVDIDPQFRIGDDTEMVLLQDEVMDELFEEEYGKKDNDAFFRLVDTFTSDRSDEELQTLVLKLYEFSRSHPFPNQWLDELVSKYDVTENTRVDDLEFGKLLLADIRLQLSGAKGLLEEAYEMTKWPGGPAPRAVNYEDDLEIIRQMERAADTGFDALYEMMNNWSFSRAKPCRGDEYDPELMKRAADLRDKAKEILNKMTAELFSRSPENFIRDMREMRPVYATLVKVVKAFARRFEQIKRDKGLVDFSDLEHLALAILVDQEKGQVSPSEVARGYRHQFKEVLIDEYQDINMVQETILQLISQDEEYNGNLFMVGDVKQSIYRFRLAEPNLFLAKYSRFSSNGENSGLRIDLSRNFRSRAEVLDGTNYLFKQIMGVQVGEIEYNDDAELAKGAGYPEDEPYPVEVAIIDLADESSGKNKDAEEEIMEEELEKSQLEARFLAGKIRKIIDEKKPVYDVKKGVSRPAQYKDIVILLRSLTWAQDMVDELRHAGIPVYANLSEGYFDATEVTIMLSLLKVIDNPEQDIPLAAVLRSPLVGLDEEELARIRLAARQGSYFEAVKQYVNTPEEDGQEETREKAQGFLEGLYEWRTLARSGPLPDLIWQLYRDTGFYEFVGGLPGGKQRQANLRALYDRASQYEETSFRGLFRFLRFIDRMRDRGKDLGVARALGEQEDVVRIMTVHSSKGLEFPIVFVSGLGREFHTKDLHRPFLIDKDYGFASKYINPEKRVSYPSLPQLALKRKKRLELVAEEMRVLYVALTRAKEKLFLVGTVKNAEKEVLKWQKSFISGEWLLKDFDRANAKAYLDWIGPALLRHRHCHISEGIWSEGLIAEHPSRWHIDIVSKMDIKPVTEDEARDSDEWLQHVKAGEPFPVESSFKHLVFTRLSWTYSHQMATNKMSKQSVSELKRMVELQDETSGYEFAGKRQNTLLFHKPKFLEQKLLSPAERGTIMHTVMQHIPLKEAPTLLSIEHLLDELIQREILTGEQADAVSGEQIVRFFETELGKRLLGASGVSREVPFTMGIPARDIYPAWDGEDELVIVQGVMDCIIEEKDGVVLLDYKTDSITNRFPGGFPHAKERLKNRYQMQVRLYERAIKEILKKKVKEAYLYFFDGGYTIEL